MNDAPKTAPSTQGFLDIFGYTNYREYLRDFYQHKKNGLRGYSYRNFSKAAGFSAPNVLKLVIDGQRGLTSDSIEKFIVGIGLKGPRAEYFRLLVQWNQARNVEEGAAFYQKLHRLIPESQKRLLDHDSVEYLSHWLYPVLREMVQLLDFQTDPYWIMRRLTGRAQLSDIQKALRFLIDKDFIAADATGRWQITNKVIMSNDEVRDLAIQQYHKKALEQSQLMVDDLPLQEREYGALIFTLPEDKIPELKDKMKNLRNEIFRWATEACENNDKNAVIQFNMQMFPQVRRTPS